MTFSLQPHDLLPADLAAKYPGSGPSRDTTKRTRSRPGASISAPQGFHAMFNHQGKMVFVDPFAMARATRSITSRMPTAGWKRKLTRLSVARPKSWPARCWWMATSASAMSSPSRRRGEYTQYHGGTVEAGLGAITTLLNRVNEVYQRDVAAEFQLASGNDTIIFTDAATDPSSTGMIPPALA